MKRIFIYLILIIVSITTHAQNEISKLVEFGKAYKNFMFINNPTNEFLKNLEINVPSNMLKTKEFVFQTIIPKTKIIDKKFLTLPDDETLKYIYIIRQINYNIHDKEPVANEKIAEEYLQKDIPRNDLIDAYYGMIFASYGNKIKPFNMSKVNFRLNDYNLKNDTEKGIFFLRCMEFCGKNIWGLINIAKPMNTKGAYELITKFPTFNGLKYYQYNDFNFPDFDMVIVKDKGLMSYKGYYIDKYYETLLNHLLCLKKESKPEKEYNELLLGSILRDKDLYKYSKKKDILENLFTEIKKD